MSARTSDRRVQKISAKVCNKVMQRARTAADKQKAKRLPLEKCCKFYRGQEGGQGEASKGAKKNVAHCNGLSSGVSARR